MYPEKPGTLVVDPRQYTAGLAPCAPVRIYDTTLRDGEQMPGVAIAPEQKYIIAQQISDIGCHILDIGFPGSSASDRLTLQLILQGKRRRQIRQDLEIVVMCRADRNDIDATVETIESLSCSPEEVTFLIFTSASDLHCRYKLGPLLNRREGNKRDEDRSLLFFREANKKLVSEAIAYACSRGVKKIEFGTEDASRTAVDQLIELVRTAVAAGATRYIFPDTTGTLTPEATRVYCGALSKSFPNIERVSHFHNDFGLGTANTIVGVLNGFTTVSTTVNGIGERAGNAPLHSVVTALKYLYGIEIAGFQYDRLAHLKRIVEKISGIPVQAHEPVIGFNAFSHESGIHTHGVSICRLMYEAIPFEAVGGVPRCVYGKHSGRNGIYTLLVKYADEIGSPATDELVAAVVLEVKAKREQVAETQNFDRYIREYYEHLDQLGINEDEIITIAKQIVRTRATVASQSQVMVDS